MSDRGNNQWDTPAPVNACGHTGRDHWCATEKPKARPRKTPKAPKTELTPREREVVALMVEGLSNKLIADRLDMSDWTAKFHVANICRKLGTTVRTRAAVEAIRRGLV